MDGFCTCYGHFFSFPRTKINWLAKSNLLQIIDYISGISFLNYVNQQIVSFILNKWCNIQ